MKTFILGALALASLPTTATAAGFINGSFEQGTPVPGEFVELGNGSTAITGWTVQGSSIDYIATYWQHQDGNRSIDLNGSGPGAIQQTFDTIAGATYNVRFWIAGNPNNPDAKVVTTVASGGLPMMSTFTTGGTRSQMNWQEQSYAFTAGSTTTTLAFFSGNDTASGPALDNVSVTAVPEPATWAMMLVGFGAIGGTMRRRSTQARIALA